MTPQVTRICIVFGCLVFAFLGLKSVVVPDSFGKLGHYRYAALAELQGHPQKFAGKETCIKCHGNTAPHSQNGVSCESCHGPGAAHAKDDSIGVTVMPTRAACGACHAMSAARRDTFPQVDLSEHNPGQRCVDCHKMHMKLDVKAARSDLKAPDNKIPAGVTPPDAGSVPDKAPKADSAATAAPSPSGPPDAGSIPSKTSSKAPTSAKPQPTTKGSKS
ncbi:MAG: cytochrome c3 family protein [Fimbriimonas sp.]|nr:cytochrome c3 family protein [Fimbriimonas sp.]